MHGNNHSWTIHYHLAVVKKDIPSLDKEIATRIRTAIERKLMLDPIIYGSPLRSTLKQFFKLRVGDWRVIYQISPTRRVVEILVIAHRSVVYARVLRRI